MWEKLDHVDLDRARQELDRRHAETVRRHAEELADLDGELAGVETLNQLIGAFAEKYKKSTGEPAPTREPSEGGFQTFAAD